MSMSAVELNTCKIATHMWICSAHENNIGVVLLLDIWLFFVETEAQRFLHGINFEKTILLKNQYFFLLKVEFLVEKSIRAS